MDYLSALNPEQKKAAQCLEGPVLILAGAGSGKTRVLTTRIVNLIQNNGVSPREIFAVTFTNKAAAEMRHRVFSLLHSIGLPQYSERDLWVGTFHSACVKILRSEIHHLGYQNSFTIYDDSDQLSLIKACLKDLNLSDSTYSPKSIQSKINQVKNGGRDVYSYESAFGGPFEDAFVRVFEKYTQVLQKSAAVDFADLILLTVKIFKQFPKVLEAYQNRFPYIMVDEYQDTNHCQYLLITLLANRYQNICVVGDEDQSIYKWRGADISNILNFEKDFPSAHIFKLEQNYRSSKNIIEAASHVIANNTERRDKSLWTDNHDGEAISLVEAYDEYDEAQKTSQRIIDLEREGNPLNEIAVFYRTNAQSRVIEDVFRSKGLNYQIYGGLRFYDRLEIKDILAYLKLINNPSDDVSFRRIINVPARSIGATSLEKLTDKAKEHSYGLYELLTHIYGPKPTISSDFLGRSAKHFLKFYDLMQSLIKAKDNLLPSDLVQLVIEDSLYRKTLTDENTTESQGRLENLAQLRQSVIEYELRSSSEDPSKPLTLENFLVEVTLISDLDRFDPNAPAVKMMTIHMAKGLEFDHVFIVGLEEELFPSIRPWEPEDPANVEEERRLFYVGMTRARKKLCLLYAKNRNVFGNAQFRVLSRFVEEIPEKYIEAYKADFFSRKKSYQARPSVAPFFNKPLDEDFSQIQPDHDSQDISEEAPKIGTRVYHPLFGEGIIKKSFGDDKVLVDFLGRGTKKISLRFTQLRFD